MLAVIVLSAGYVLCEYRLFYTMLIDSHDTIRVSMVQPSLGLADILRNIGESLLYGDMHTDSVHRFFVMPVCMVWLLVSNYLHIKNKEVKKIFTDPYNGIILFIVFNSLIYGLYYWEPLRNLFETVIPPLKGFEFQRTEFTNPFLWYLALFLAAKGIYDILPKHKKLSELIIVIAIFVIVLSNTRYNDLFHTCYDRFLRIAKGKPSNELTYEEFYSEKLFDEIKKDIGYSGQWSVAYGFYPAVLEYNGINTLDGYLGYYSDYYKKEFRKIIEPALERVPESKTYYDNWGARCYVYSGTYTSNTNAYRNYEYTDEDIYIDLDAFKDWGGRYIFSRVILNNAEETGLELVDTYSDERSPYTVYLYRTVSRYQTNVHSDVPYEDRKELSYDTERFDEILEQIKTMAAEAGTDPITPQQEEQFLMLYDEAVDSLRKMTTCRSMAEIEYYGDVADEELVEKKDAIFEDILDESDAFLAALREAANSSYETALTQVLNSYIVDSLKEYEDMTEEEKERSLKLESLQSDYEQATMENYYYEYDGEEWDMNKLYERASTLSRKEIKKIFSGIYEEEAAVIGEIYLEIIQLENEIARDEGYDNYAEYAYSAVYARDYSVDDIKKLCKEIRKQCSDALESTANLYSRIAEYDPGYLTEDDRETFETIYSYLDEIDPELQISMKHLLDCNLFDLKSVPTKPDKGFTINLPYYGDAYIFDSPYVASNDLFTYVHEFGHYNNAYYTQENEFESVSNLDNAETHSQGLEVLFSEYYTDIYGEETGTYLQVAEIYNLMNSVSSACMITEFEIYAHEHPDTTVEELGRYFAELNEEYELGVYYLDLDEVYTWIDIPHIFVQPCYYISYATSALAALDIYSLSLTDYELACEKYMEITALKSYWYFKETLQYVGLPDVFEEGVSKEIFEKCYRDLKKKVNRM